MTQTNGLARRVELVEQRLADQERRRRADRLAQRHGLDPAELLAEIEATELTMARLRAQGATARQIVEELAAEAGLTADELEREAERIINDDKEGAD